MTTARSVLERLKPHALCEANVAAEATTYKDSRVAGQSANLCMARCGFYLRFGYGGQRGFQNVQALLELLRGDDEWHQNA
jgi:hypothetical protein